ncbi:UDP-glucose--hexose-1-phosphate uridylyltransferase [Gracilimonas mengyeensis]|uniref:Galactose-1-phosphate uridylyltransferase n=1 Tax=Gracilimonas mengyeensis TaxID=1302730 RepID=A0A521BSC3_9BACT|nr:UDP-glucose--hexose-1-phosphate uridylyltransferase [Gracilimonas mengyeensis]SMO50019.1 UDPglucose--hexose-1-phosphate uridylyltransferase [Gracilimonas mengyeensis]
MNLDFSQHPHRRLNLLTGEWVQVSPHRTKRPWQGQEEDTAGEKKPKYDPGCYLCPGNERAGDAKNPDYESTFSFVNDFSALLPDTSDEVFNEGGLLIAKGERGICKVICFSPRHDLTLPEMEPSQVEDVVDLWVKEYRELGERDYINYVQIFENKGEVMGCSNPHPHGQIWAQETVPEEPAKEWKQFKKHYEKHGRTLLEDYLKLELDKKERVVVENDHFAVVVPFWAFWPFETLVISKRPFARLTDMNEAEKKGLADIVRRLTIKYDNVFKVSFPYSAGHHPAPTDGEDHPEWHYHMHFYPPLLRSATIKKFRVGYEMLANPQRDVTAEYSAGLLRDLPEVHYKQR